MSIRIDAFCGICPIWCRSVTALCTDISCGRMLTSMGAKEPRDDFKPPEPDAFEDRLASLRRKLAAADAASGSADLKPLSAHE